ncbi:hypothetical protein K2173_021373 [Erythroxylum novogranatense]|uniref:Pentatricopeptide repeat-containing protein n=1 Tax=Erythroxylum novogranatense TaxID=1862640 RepID=A0AAV8TUU2_9ROSI|nr:hypothetical protein K2173_021373 [Erythroxylum novogranatense]
MVAHSRSYSTTKALAITPKQLTTLSQLREQSTLLKSQLVSALHCCKSLAQFKQVHVHIILNGLSQCCYVVTKLVRTLTGIKVPVDHYPRSVFDQVENPNSFLYTSVVRAYSVQGLVAESISLYGDMRRRGIRPVSFTFSAVFKACGAEFDVGLGRQMHAQTIVIGGFESDLHVGNSMINMYVKCGSVECGRKVFDEMPARDLISWTELIVACAKYGDMESASELFEKLPVKDIVIWTAMITGFAQNACPREAIKYFERMQDVGVGVDEVSLAGVISACAQLGVAKYANWIADVAEKSGFGFGNNVIVGSSLVDVYSKCGSIEDAYRIFGGLKEKNVFSYSSMIMGFAIHGRPHAAMELFHEMLRTEIKPNGVTFIGVLTAYSHAGMVEQGRSLFKQMNELYGIEPSADHYTCMVDLLARAGHLKEALELIETMPMKPPGGVWGALLGACRIHVNPDIAKIAASHLFELEPNCIGNYILLINIYASAGRWKDVSEMRELVIAKGLKKNPTGSWFEGKEGVKVW